ncbi:PAS domain-containing sensor histidine kinase [Janthinobacterium sp. CG_S6]|uniref:PAS domain-containing sensor histidine kinase n=1 Tax=Janthinobacterium sp. CG_S6 TaxID=3071707 RepID=UPI002DFE1368|nr:signal transduction histidine kinase/DNA-binding response OmpR family regulator [Janthinobacterium sp. CG_S6]
MKQPLPSQPARSGILLITRAPEDMHELLVELDRHGLRDVRARDLDRAVALAGDGIALILLDAALAGADLAGAYQRLIGAAGGHAAPLFLLSAAPSAAEQSRSIGAGAADYIKLPCNALELTEKILVELALREDAGGAGPARPPVATHPQTLEVNYHSVLAGSPEAVLLLDVDNDRLIDVNHHAVQLLGRSVDALLQTNLVRLCAPLQPGGRAAAALIPEKIAQALAGDMNVFEAVCLDSDGRQVACEVRLLMLSVPGRRLVHVRVVDLTARKLAEALRAGQNSLLEMIAKGAPLEQTLTHLLLMIEAQSRGVLCSVMLLDDDGRHMRGGAGPSLPAAYLAALEGVAIGPAAGSCGTAMYRKGAVLVGDIEHDPLWAPYRALAGEHGLRACWSVPIQGRERVLGSFAMYYRAVRRPSQDDLRLLEVAVHIAGIAIGRSRHERELQRHRSELEALVAQRTAALTLAKERADLVNAELAGALETLSRTQGELVRRDKLAALGALVAGIAHELNTPIGNSLVVCSTMAERTRLLREGLDGGLRRSVLEAYLGQAAEADAIVLRNLQRAANLVSSFKQIAVDRASSQRRRFELRQFVAELMLPLCAQLKDSGFAVDQLIPGRLLLDSYPGALGQVLSSLFENCLRHAFEGRERGRIVLRAEAGAGGELALSIADDGAGIEPAHLGRVFDPFFTTKLGSGGSGLGLHIAHNLVTSVLGGRIEAASAGAGGTTFTLHLPTVAPAPAP